MSALRVCAIAHDYYPFDALVRRTAESAAKAGYESHVICLMEPGQAKYEVCDGVHVHRVPMKRGYGRALPLTLLEWFTFTVRAGAKVTRLHFKQKFDVIHVHNMPDFLVFSTIVPKLFGAKIVLEVQDTSPELMAAKAHGRLRAPVVRVATWQEQISTAFADHVITVGWPFEELLLERGVPASKLTNIINSADPSIFRPDQRTDPFMGPVSEARPLILMYHGTVAERNGLDTAMRAFAKARATVPYLQFDIKGVGEGMPALERLAHELAVDDHVVFSDPCPSEELGAVVSHGDVGIIPYRSDGFMDLVLPTKAYEFAFMRRPMIASDTPAIRSMFRPESIVLCEPSNVDSFAEAIVDLYQHPEKRAELVANAERDYTPFRWELISERYQQLLTSLKTN